MPSDVQSCLRVSRFESNGIFRRIYDSVAASCSQGDVNHVTGDAHYLANSLRPNKTILTVHDCVGLNNCGGLLYLNLPFGMPIIETQSAGRTLLTSNISSMPVVAGYAACLVDLFSVEEIRRGLERIINDSVYRDDLVKQGFENCARFNPKQIATRYYDLYKEIVAHAE